MGLIYTKKKDEETQNSADPWNIYGVGFGRESKADSEKVAWEVRSTTEETHEIPHISHEFLFYRNLLNYFKARITGIY